MSLARHQGLIKIYIHRPSARLFRQTRPFLQKQTSNSYTGSSYSTSGATAARSYPDQKAIESLLARSPCLQLFRQNGAYIESRPHLLLPEATRQNHIIAGPLTGPGRISVAPYVFTRRPNNVSAVATAEEAPDKARPADVITIFHVGAEVSGHPGFMQGGLMAVMFDEAFARVVSPVLPSGVGMTVNLGLDFRSPALLDRVYVMEAELVRAEGRKAWATGVLRDAGPSGSGTDEVGSTGGGAMGTLVAEAKALFVEPRFAESMVPLYNN